MTVMRTARTASLLILAAGMLACQGTTDEPVEIGTHTQSLCDTNAETYPVLATLAVAMGIEVGRFQPLTDLVIRNANGQIINGNWGTAASVELRSAALSRCNARKVPGCPSSAALLSLQDDGSAFPELDWDGANATNYFWQLVSGFQRQKDHEADLSANAPELLAGQHELYYVGTSDQGGCSVHTDFEAYGENTAHLDSKLVFFGGEQNPYIDFRATEDTVSVDPDAYLTDSSGMTHAPICYTQCTVYSSALLGECCSCNGKSGKYYRLRAGTFVCK